MSVPLPSPSPSPLTPSGGGSVAKSIPRSRPTPISTASPHSPSSPGSSLKNRDRPASSISRSLLNDDNWRDRSPIPAPTPSTATLNGKTPSTATITKGPERTVGGFEKREIKSAVGVSGLSAGAGLSKEKDKKNKKEQEEIDDSKASLAHVPCRFFKAGACTAGDSCPFSHAAPDSAKREVCQWFLKGNCKFGHKCALAHVRPGEPMSMDRKNKKSAQLEARERGDSVGAGSAPPAPSSGTGTANNGLGESPRPLGIMRGRKNSTSPGEDQVASPVPIKSALSSSMQSPQGTGRLPSSPLREPFGPPSGALPNSPNSAGFTHPRGIQGFASSPSRPSPLSASFGANGTVPGPLSLKASSSNPLGSPLRPPVTTAPGFSSSFSHPSLSLDRSSQTIPLSASFAGDGKMRSIWAKTDGPAEPLSPRRPIPQPSRSQADVFIDDEDHGEDFLPSSLSDLLTPRERARRMSRRDSQGAEDFSQSPSGRYGNALWNGVGGERLAQSAGPTMGPGGFLQSLWSAEGEDVRKTTNDDEEQGEGEVNDQEQKRKDEFTFGPSTAKPQRQTSLLTQQRSPITSTTLSPTSPIRQIPSSGVTTQDQPYLLRNLNDPSSPSTRVLQEHLPGQSLPGGLASALSRLHMHNSNSNSKLSNDESKIVEHDQGNSKKSTGEDEEEALFDMDG
ncbi:uncharacterized protein IL334_002690 [Kwoniella shivajii]|uniref:C3H1-type domain-containing protein n=1 Tax=Kwoniella shivajii TaxID=564305 RepID=A0ABZ1CZL6_9TREE|nr:hypothetical protein IL334_002690 [Kwoniella shivajii]